MVDFKILLMMMIGLSSAVSKPACKDIGGKCMGIGLDCDGEVLLNVGKKKYCNKKSEFCCVPNGCPVWEDGYFYYAPSSQCFYFPGSVATYDNGLDKCKDLGMTLAHPYDSRGLRRYMVERWGWAEPYLGAMRNVNGTDGDLFYWNDNGAPVPSSYWFPDHPRDGDYCMILLVRDWRMKTNPEQPFYSYTCSKEYYTLCERKP